MAPRTYGLLVAALLAACGSVAEPQPPQAGDPPAVNEETQGKDAGQAPKPAQPELASPRAYDQRGDEHLLGGRPELAIEDYDRYLAAEPAAEPHHWRRGIAYYYAGEFALGVAQFELHRSVNPNDVENATWHYLCYARLHGVEAAKAALLPVGPDSRAPMGEVLEMFAGRSSPERVLAAAGASAQRTAVFYGQLYVGLYHEAAGNAALAAKHIRLAAEDPASGSYMGDVARMHAKRF